MHINKSAKRNRVLWLLLGTALAFLAYGAGTLVASTREMADTGIFSSFLPALFKGSPGPRPVVPQPGPRTQWLSFRDTGYGYAIQYPPSLSRVLAPDLILRNHNRPIDGAPEAGEVTITATPQETAEAFDAWLARNVRGVFERTTVVGRPAARQFAPSETYNNGRVARLSYFVALTRYVLVIEGVTAPGGPAADTLDIVNQMVETLRF